MSIYQGYIEDKTTDCCVSDISLVFDFQDPTINITELKEIHSEINLTVPDPILIPKLHDGLEAVRDTLKLI